MLILALDSATPVAGVALWEDGKLLREEFVNYKKTHSETLMPMVKQVLDACEKQINQVNVLAVTVGPGSFTGLRIGLAAVKGMALAQDIPVIGISTLEVMAHNFSYTDALVCPLLDARKKEVYAGFFSVAQRYPQRLGEDVASSPEKFVSAAQQQCQQKGKAQIILLGDGVYPYQIYFQEKLGSSCVIAPTHLMLPRASALADLAGCRAKDEKYDDALSLRPVYLRLSEAEYRLGKGEL